ncbi:MAG: hypothetical protein MI922_25755, partial [Bacteroidales bacterium]|nr:hypothetical protein [Bacteroidales bacterium]
MNKGIVRITIVGIFILLYSFQTFGNDYENLQFETIFTNDGLDFPHIKEVVQDGDGYIWFGTGGGGLYRYDGLTMKKFTSVYENDHTLSGNDITRFLIDSKNRFWIGTTTGLSLYHNKFETFSRLHPNKTHPYNFKSNVIQRIYEDSKGKIWVGSPGGLSRIIERDTTFTVKHYIMTENSEDTLLYSVTDICEYDSNNLLVGTKHGLFNLQVNTSKFNYVDLGFKIPPRINSLLPDQTGKIFAGTTRGLVRILSIHPPGEFELFHHKEMANVEGKFTSNNIHKLQIDHSGVLWCGAINGLNLLFHKDLTKTQQTRILAYNKYPNPQNSTAGTGINDIYFDKEGTTWIATYSGVSKLIQKNHCFVNPLQWKEINKKYLNGDVRCVHEDNHGYLWIVYFGRGIALYNLNTKEFISFPGDILPINHIFSILIDDNNIVWVAAYNDVRGGLYKMQLPPGFYQKFNFEDIKFKRYHFPGKVRKPGNINFGKWIHKDKGGNIWYLTREGGACKFEFKDDSEYNNPTITQYWNGNSGKHHIPMNNTSHMVEDKKGTLWLSTRGGGFGRYNKETGSFKWYLQNPKKLNGLSQDKITCMHVDDSNKLWLATIGNGLNIFDPETENFDYLDTKS